MKSKPSSAFLSETGYINKIPALKKKKAGICVNAYVNYEEEGDIPSSIKVFSKRHQQEQEAGLAVIPGREPDRYLPYR
jgi:hypothetical protein